MFITGEAQSLSINDRCGALRESLGMERCLQWNPCIDAVENEKNFLNIHPNPEIDEEFFKIFAKRSMKFDGIERKDWKLPPKVSKKDEKRLYEESKRNDKHYKLCKIKTSPNVRRKTYLPNSSE